MSPDVVPDASQGQKPCWTCSEVIPYQKGWCDSCWEALGKERQNLIHMAGFCLDRTLVGRVFSAVCDSLREERRPRPAPFKAQVKESYFKGKRVKITLDDLEIII